MARLKDWLEGLSYSVYMGTDEGEVSELITDSRKAAPGALFICIKGSRVDAHDFIPAVIAAGCTDIVAERVPELSDEIPAGVNIITVPDTKKAMAYISAARFGYPAESLILVGITGTKGKTSASYMLKKILDEASVPAALIGTNGCIVGDERIATVNTTPDSYTLSSLFRLMVERGIKVCVMECSSQGFKLFRTEGLRFAIGIFLNIAPDHIGPGEHESFDEYLQCKKVLMTQSDTAIINIDDAHGAEFMETARQNAADIVTLSLIDQSADLYAFDISYRFDKDFSGSSFRVRGIADEEIELSIPGDYYIYNALGVIAAAVRLGVGMDYIKKALKNVHVDGRMEIVIRTDGFMCMVDYAHNGVSMVNLIRTLRCYKHGRIVVVFGCGGNRSRDRRTEMGAAAAKSADLTILTSDNSRFEKTEDIIRDIADAYLDAGGDEDRLILIPDRREAIGYALEHALDGDIIAVIGKGHENYQEENGVRHHFLDKEEILKAAERLGLCT